MTSPTDKPLSHACIIMASGSGTRFGGNKLMANLAGMPLVEHVLRATEGHFAERVVVTRHADVAQLARKTGARAVVHDLPLRNEAVALGMDALTCCDTVTFFQGDQPLVAARTIDALLAAAERGELEANGWVLPIETVFTPLPALRVNDGVKAHLLNGCPTSHYAAADGRYRAYDSAGAFLGLATVEGGVLKVEKLFCERG